METIPCTYSDAIEAEERADQLFPGTASFLTFSKSRVHPGFLAKPLHLLPGDFFAYFCIS